MKKRKFRQLVEDALSSIFGSVSFFPKLYPNATNEPFKSGEEQDEWISQLEEAAEKYEAVQGLLTHLLREEQKHLLRMESQVNIDDRTKEEREEDEAKLEAYLVEQGTIKLSQAYHLTKFLKF